MMKLVLKPRQYSTLLERIAGILRQARTKVIREINRAQVLAYWEIGREIVEFEQKGKVRAEYGEELMERLSRDMTRGFGRGFSPTNLKMMRLFYQAFPIRQTLSDESTKGQKSVLMPHTFDPMLSWSHYCELLKVEEPLARSFYEKEANHSNWSVRELKRQINSMLFERLALSRDPRAVMTMAKRGQIIKKPEDA